MGCIKTGDAVRPVIDGLRTLEYRGYDSYGIVFDSGGEALRLTRGVGSITKADEAGAFGGVGSSHLALGHTRWATHGGVSEANAHPHLSFDGNVAIVHNGVIANHLVLRRELSDAGIELKSETDSEVVAHLIALEIARGTDVLASVGKAVARLDGEYALGIVVKQDPLVMYGAKNESPLLVAWNGDGAILCSDQLAACSVSNDLTYFEDRDIFRLAHDGVEIFKADGDGALQSVQRATVATGESYSVPSKGEFAHYMLKEIHEIPAVIEVAAQATASELRGAVPESATRTTLIGSGSAFYVARIGQYFLNTLARLSTHALPSDEAPYWTTFDRGDAVLAISQSGETYDTLSVIRTALKGGAHITSLGNVPGSSQERLATHCLRQGAGPEICVLSTKSVISQVVLLARLALRLGVDNGHLPVADFERYEASIARLPETLRTLLEDSEELRRLAVEHAPVEHWFFIGRGPLYPVALESALKFKEISYRHAEGLPAGFFKHGTISLIDDDFHTVALLPSRGTAPERFQATVDNVSEIVARRGPVLGIGPHDASADERDEFTRYLGLPLHGDDIADVVVHLVAGQMFAYFCALELGREIDQPRSLAKSVTVR
jgi:glutamine---fructose-6-phosphate transaminase (isomerizing)